MALSIRLSHDESKPLTPGSMVLGVVKFVSNQDLFIEALSVDFRGHTNASLHQNFGDLAVSRTDYVSRSYLFSRHLDVYTGECIHRKGTYAWPFAFRIPLFAAPRVLPRGSREMFHQIFPWKGDATMEPHPLPPSMIQGGNFACSVQYVLEATLLQRTPPTEGQKTKTKEVNASRTISVDNLEMPSRTPAGYEWPYKICHQVMRCPHPTPAGTQLAVRRLLGVVSRKLQRPSNDPELRLSVLLPKKLEIKEDSALAVLVSGAIYDPTAATDGPQSPTEPCPDLCIHSFKISLNQHTAVRAGCHSSLSVKHIFTRKGSCQVPISRCYRPATETAPYALATPINLCDVVDLNVPTELLGTDFSTYNIARFHRLDASFSMTYMGKKHKLRLREVPIRVAPCSGEQLERTLSEGLEIDDEYGCELAGIKWRCYRQRQSDFAEDGWQISELVAGGPMEENEFAHEILPPPYTF